MIKPIKPPIYRHTQAPENSLVTPRIGSLEHELKKAILSNELKQNVLGRLQTIL